MYHWVLFATSKALFATESKCYQNSIYAYMHTFIHAYMHSYIRTYIQLILSFHGGAYFFFNSFLPLLLLSSTLSAPRSPATLRCWLHTPTVVNVPPTDASVRNTKMSSPESVKTPSMPRRISLRLDRCIPCRRSS